MAVDEIPNVIVQFITFPGVEFKCPSCSIKHQMPDPQLAMLIQQGKVITGTCQKCGAEFHLVQSKLVLPK